MQWDIVQLFQIHELLKCGKIKKSIMNFKSHSGLVRFKSGNFFFLTILVNISLSQRMTNWPHSKVFFRDRLCQPINQLLYTNILLSLWDKVIVLRNQYWPSQPAATRVQSFFVTLLCFVSISRKPCCETQHRDYLFLTVWKLFFNFKEAKMWRGIFIIQKMFLIKASQMLRSDFFLTGIMCLPSLSSLPLFLPFHNQQILRFSVR